MKRDVLTFGEVMIRMSPPGGRRIGQATSFDLWVGGSEANVAAGLACLDLTVTWVGRLPDQPLGRRIESELLARGIDVSHVVWTSPTDRVGLYFAEEGTEPRPATIIYDRVGSAATSIAPDDIPDTLLASHRHLHLSGITPALSEQCAATTVDILRRAKSLGLTISFDINFRARLWTAEDAVRTLEPMLRDSDIIFCSRDDAVALFGHADEGDAELAATMQSLFQGDDRPKVLFILTLGDRGAAAWGPTFMLAPAVPVASSKGRIGSGDAFVAGFLSEYLSGAPVDRALQLGTAMASLKRTVPGDMLVATRAEIEAVLAKERVAWR